jgi:3-oxoacyl-[acyl-carrier-protein] synthase-3
MTSLHQGPETRRAVIAGTGSYIPARRVPNSELEKVVETNDEWIVQRTGIRERRVAAPEEASSDMAAAAARAALADAGVDAAQVDLILVATCTPDMVFPNTASVIQQKMGATRAAACLDLNAACSGFVYALEVGSKFVASGTHQCTCSSSAPRRCPASPTGRTAAPASSSATAPAPPVLRPELRPRRRTSTANIGIRWLPRRPAARPRRRQSPARHPRVRRCRASTSFAWSGREVFKHAVTNMSRIGRQLLLERNRRDLRPNLQLVIPHQANQRIISAVSEKLGLPLKKGVHERRQATATPPPPRSAVAIDEAARSGLLRRGDTDRARRLRRRLHLGRDADHLGQGLRESSKGEFRSSFVLVRPSVDDLRVALHLLFESLPDFLRSDLGAVTRSSDWVVTFLPPV